MALHFWRGFGYFLCILGIIATLILAPFTVGISLLGTLLFAILIWRIKKSGELATINKNIEYIADRERRLDKELAEREKRLKEEQQKLLQDREKQRRELDKK